MFITGHFVLENVTFPLPSHEIVGHTDAKTVGALIKDPNQRRTRTIMPGSVVPESAVGIECAA